MTWHTVWPAAKPVITRRVDDPNRLAAVTSLGVGEHVWKPGWHRPDRAVTGMGQTAPERGGEAGVL